ncbi:hypothetical protein [Bacillus thuringiensis]|uniref:hypothetical protein n=1 Tax=Bacillus thuringiensis TaxID=1428 RepID=UPI000B44C326|nr:hypothetical protein [Bacillus thuringiensis]MED3183783.1 hypothetical protein [Bacillus thuringiensis]OTY11439.1 hypothetical protein BK734_12070 [Bacillus thuringiensis serovar kim]OUB13631.1 hypothetical protein BK733_27260 [Bacillus thuringiensis serovar xiaguangiensis]
MGNNLPKEIMELRQEFRKNRFLRVEFVAMLSRLLREHQVTVTPILLANIQLAISEEIPEDQISSSIDPPDEDPRIDPPPA